MAISGDILGCHIGKRLLACNRQRLEMLTNIIIQCPGQSLHKKRHILPKMLIGTVPKLRSAGLRSC